MKLNIHNCVSVAGKPKIFELVTKIKLFKVKIPQTNFN